MACQTCERHHHFQRECAYVGERDDCPCVTSETGHRGLYKQGGGSGGGCAHNWYRVTGPSSAGPSKVWHCVWCNAYEDRGRYDWP